ncbi:hypothetical protein [Cerasicoccus arenae]|nr:hypothetical protein [Cerasicoccus arenae]MBK1857028.1 hypothetical protein [Cerasicoccus arenae]
MSYSATKLLSILTISAASAASLNAATLAEFTFFNSGADIDETAGWQPAGGASLDPKVIIDNNTATFNNTLGLTIAPLITFPIQIGMQPLAGANSYGGTVNPAGSNPTNPGQATGQLAAIGQFTILNDLTPTFDAPIGYQILPESIVIQGVGTNLSGILLQDNKGDVSFQPTPGANGAFTLTFDLVGRLPISFFGPEHYTLYLVGSNSGGAATGATFSSINNDFVQFNGIVEAIPEPSTYMAGATAIMLGAFVCYRRKKAKKNA